MDIINKVKSLDLPVGQYMLIGGSNLAVRGFRDTRDLDILVAPDLFNRLLSEGVIDLVRLILSQKA